jgi:hypothetical protein
MTEPTEVAPWTIKAVPTSFRESVIRAAKRADMTVPVWLQTVLAEHLDPDAPLPTAAAPARLALTGPAHAETLAGLVDTAMKLSALPAEQRADPLIRSASAAVRSGLAGLRRG